MQKEDDETAGPDQPEIAVNQNVAVVDADSPPIIVKHLRPNDVLLGRGAPIIKYEGNIRFRAIIRARKKEYAAARRRVEKDVIAYSIVQLIAKRNGRFLQRIPSERSSSQQGGPSPSIDGLSQESPPTLWKVADREVATEKVKQALRDKDPIGQRQREESMSNPVVAGMSMATPHVIPLSSFPPYSIDAHQQQLRLRTALLPTHPLSALTSSGQHLAGTQHLSPMPSSLEENSSITALMMQLQQERQNTAASLMMQQQQQPSLLASSGQTMDPIHAAALMYPGASAAAVSGAFLNPFSFYSSGLSTIGGLSEGNLLQPGASAAAAAAASLNPFSFYSTGLSTIGGLSEGNLFSMYSHAELETMVQQQLARNQWLRQRLAQQTVAHGTTISSLTSSTQQAPALLDTGPGVYYQHISGHDSGEPPQQLETTGENSKQEGKLQEDEGQEEEEEEAKDHSMTERGRQDPLNEYADSLSVDAFSSSDRTDDEQEEES